MLADHVFNVNFQSDVVKIPDGALLLKNVKDGILHPLPLGKARSCVFSIYVCFMLYVSFCARMQQFLARNYPAWFWTSLSRARDLSKVKFFKYSKDTDDSLDQQLVMSYFERKVENYKLQDRKAEQQVPKQGYVNAERFLKNTLLLAATSGGVHSI